MRDLYRFCILSFTFLLIFSSLYLAKNIKEVSNGEYKYTLPGREIYQAIGKSQRKTNKKKLIIGDSTGNQFFSVFIDEDSIYSLACNQVIGMCGHYFLLDDFLKNGNRPEQVYMIFNVFSFSNNLDQNYTFHYFLKPHFLNGGFHVTSFSSFPVHCSPGHSARLFFDAASCPSYLCRSSQQSGFLI